MKTFFIVIGCLILTLFLWFMLICAIVFVNPQQTEASKEFNPVAVAPEAPVLQDVIDAEVRRKAERKARLEQARSDLELSRAALRKYLEETPNDLSRQKAENEKQRARMCAAGDIPKEYCDE